MVYDPFWKRLNDAVRLVMDATESSKEEAQADICRAVADRVIRFQARLKKQAYGPMTSKSELDGAAFDRLTTIKPDDLDWEQSRPLKPWLVKRGAHRPHGWWNLDWIEVSRADIASVLCAGGQVRGAAALLSTAKTNSRPKVQAAKRAIQALYPDGPPDQVALPNKELVWRVGEKLKELGLPEVKPDTIFRAASRRRK